MAAPWGRGRSAMIAVAAPYSRRKNAMNYTTLRGNAVEARWGRGDNAVASPWERRASATHNHGVHTATLLRCHGVATALLETLRRCHGDRTELPPRSLPERRGTVSVLCMLKTNAVPRSSVDFTATPRRSHGVLGDATELLPRPHGASTEFYNF